MNQKTRFLLVSLSIVAVIGCSPNHEENIRIRAQQFAKSLVEEDYEGCVTLTDPRFLERFGAEGAKLRFRIMGAFVKLGKITADRVQVGEINVAEDAKTATVVLSIKSGEEWKPLPPQNWVFADSQWYVKLD